MKYKLIADLHTHTIYSHMGPYLHALGTIHGNVRAAHNCGLREIAITDHGPKELYGLNPKKIPKMRRQIVRAMKRFPDVKVLLGVESNIIDSPNGLDVEPENIGDYDFINAGYHYGAPHCRSVLNWLAFHLPCPKWVERKMSDYNTALVARALHNNNVKVLTHPGDKAYFDMAALGKACEETDTLVEINARHARPNADDLKILAKYDVKFIIGSDAHKPSQVGRYEDSVKLALAAGIGADRIVNIK